MNVREDRHAARTNTLAYHDCVEMKMIVRPRRPDDIDLCVGLLADVRAADGYPMHWPADPRRWLAPENLLTAWVAEAEHSLVGHVALCSAVGDSAAPVWSAASGLSPNEIAAVAQLFVAPSARGQRLGAILLAGACSEACSRGLLPALEVLDHDRSAISLYEHLGWRRVGSAPAAWAQVGDKPTLLHYYLAPDGVDELIRTTP